MFKEISASEITDNPFDLIGQDWMLVAAGTKDDCNMMTASWGALGVIWGKPSATCYIRETRYTKEYVDRGDYFTLNFFTDDYREALNVCGTSSGRDCDKIKESKLTPSDFNGVAGFEEARMVLVCRKQYHTEMPLSGFDVEENVAKWYGDGNKHSMYIGSIENVFVKKG